MSSAPPTGQLISIARAREIIAAEVCEPLAAEPVEVGQAIGRALAEPVRALDDVPPFANSAMDGFAVRAGDAARRLPIVGESRAGQPFARSLREQEAVRISTGAVLPDGAEAVVPLESATEQEGWVTLHDAASNGHNVRGAGEDMHAGETVIPAGTRLGAAEVAVAVAAGHSELVCARRPRVAVVTSGDELRPPGARLNPGEIHDSNHVAIAALAAIAGAATGRVGPGGVGDDRAATEAVLRDALVDTDVLVITGGVSVGPHDHVKQALQALGVEERFWRVALRPGKPTWFGVRGDTLVFGLPGNPVSAMVTFLLFVRPALLALQGLDPRSGRREATLAGAIARHPARDEAVRVQLRDSPEGPRATVTGPQGSHQLTSMLGADGLVIVERGEGELAAGSRVEVEPIAAALHPPVAGVGG